MRLPLLLFPPPCDSDDVVPLLTDPAGRRALHQKAVAHKPFTRVFQYIVGGAKAVSRLDDDRVHGVVFKPRRETKPSPSPPPPSSASVASSGKIRQWGQASVPPSGEEVVGKPELRSPTPVRPVAPSTAASNHPNGLNDVDTPADSTNNSAEDDVHNPSAEGDVAPDSHIEEEAGSAVDADVDMPAEAGGADQAEGDARIEEVAMSVDATFGLANGNSEEVSDSEGDAVATSAINEMDAILDDVVPDEDLTDYGARVFAPPDDAEEGALLSFAVHRRFS